MVRIPDDELERIKREVSVAGLVRAHGVELVGSGDNLVGRCPFHDDKTPSLVITASKNLWHCMGACQQGGTVIDWAMRVANVDFRGAVKILRKNLVERATTARPLTASLSTNGDDQQLLDDVAAYYHERLKQNPGAQKYLEKRGIFSAEMVERFKIGFADRTLGLRLPLKNRALGSQMRTRLQRIGILRESGHEHFSGSLVIPILDDSGHVVEMYGRKITENLRAGTPLHLYLPGPHRGVFNVDVFKSSTEIVLCEALIDALTFWCAGIRNVTSAYGVEGFSDDIFQAMKRHGTERVLIAYDRDDAGDHAAEKLAPRLIAEGMEVLRVHFPHGLDANAYAQKVQPAEKALKVVLGAAQWIGRGAPVTTERADAGEEMKAANEEVLAAPVTLVATEREDVEEEKEAPEVEVKEPVTTDPAVVEQKTEAANEEVHEPPVTPVSAESATPLAAVVVPVTTDAEFFEQRGEDLCTELADRSYRIRGLAKASSLSVKVNISVRRGENRFHVDVLDLAAARFRAHFIKTAALELGVQEDVIYDDVGRILNEIYAFLERRQREQAKPKPVVPPMTTEEKAAAEELLRDRLLLWRVLEDLHLCGVVGEEVNKLVAYLCATSRKLEKPLAVIIRSTSGAGKSSLMDAVLSFIPDEEQVRYSAMTERSLYYVPEDHLRHKVLSLAEEEGGEKSTYPLKLLQSEGRLRIASTGKDPVTGRLETKDYCVEGPIAAMQTTTRESSDEEFLNRCIELTADESREQTRAIHDAQRRRGTLQWLKGRGEQSARRRLHQNAQRLLRTLPVYNPYAQELTFPDDKTRLRRDHPKYQALIESIALLHQYQRKIEKVVTDAGEEIEYVEATLEDVAIANRLSACVMGLSLEELRPQTRQLLMLLDELVTREAVLRKAARSELWFSRREVREATGWGNTQLKVHLSRLVDLEYLAVHRFGQGFRYELLYEGGGKDGSPFFSGLIDLQTLGYDANRSAFLAKWSGGGRPPVGLRSGGGRGDANAETPRPDAEKRDRVGENGKRALIRGAVVQSAARHSHTGNGVSAG